MINKSTAHIHAYAYVQVRGLTAQEPASRHIDDKCPPGEISTGKTGFCWHLARVMHARCARMTRAHTHRRMGRWGSVPPESSGNWLLTDRGDRRSVLHVSNAPPTRGARQAGESDQTNSSEPYHLGNGRPHCDAGPCQVGNGSVESLTVARAVHTHHSAWPQQCHTGWSYPWTCSYGMSRRTW